jgi:hypothetical protein
MIQSMLNSKDRADIAIAYWGADALTLLKVKPKRRNVRVVCCLKGGKSDPDIIAKFKKRAKQHDKLHAKVIWTPHAAVVGSANASSNGLPEEDFKATGLIEAGVYWDEPRGTQPFQHVYVAGSDQFYLRPKNFSGERSNQRGQACLARSARRRGEVWPTPGRTIDAAASS